MEKNTGDFRSSSRKKRLSRLWGWLIGISIFGIIIGVMAVIPYIEYGTFEQKDLGIKMDYPLHWQRIDNPDVGCPVAFAAPKESILDTGIPSVNVTYQNLSGRMLDFDYMTRRSVNQLAKPFAKYLKVLESRPLRLANRPS